MMPDRVQAEAREVPNHVLDAAVKAYRHNSPEPCLLLAMREAVRAALAASRADTPTDEQALRETHLRLADVQGVIALARFDDEGEIAGGQYGLCCALDHALRGTMGCVEPEEWHKRRVAALRTHADYLGLPLAAVSGSDAPATDKPDVQADMDAVCPLCSHAWRRHDPEDGKCDAPGHKTGACHCGRDLGWMRDMIASQSRAALSDAPAREAGTEREGFMHAVNTLRSYYGHEVESDDEREIAEAADWLERQIDVKEGEPHAP